MYCVIYTSISYYHTNLIHFTNILGRINNKVKHGASLIFWQIIFHTFVANKSITLFCILQLKYLTLFSLTVKSVLKTGSNSARSRTVLKKLPSHAFSPFPSFPRNAVLPAVRKSIIFIIHISPKLGFYKNLFFKIYIYIWFLIHIFRNFTASMYWIDFSCFAIFLRKMLPIIDTFNPKIFKIEVISVCEKPTRFTVRFIQLNWIT